MALIDTAYQYYLTTYGKSTVSRYDTHKKSQLRDVYNRIVKINKDSPLYKIKDPGNVTKYAIDIKESAKNLRNVICSLSDTDGGIEDVFSKKIAQSSNEDIVKAEYIGHEQANDATPGFEIQVKQLASNQVNLGNYLTPNRLDIEPGIYSFDLTTRSASYEFQYTVSSSDTNQSILKKISKLVNSAGIGMSATIGTNESGQIALHIASKQTGIADDEDHLFQISPSDSPNSAKAMQILGLHQVETAAQNSTFLLNGVEHTAYANTFTVDNRFDLTLQGINQDGESTTIGFKANVDAVIDNIQRLADAYNDIIDVACARSDSRFSSKLVRDIGGVARSYYNELEAIGISINESSHISIDRSLLTDAITAPDSDETFAVLNRFKDTLSERTSRAFIDPMNYVNKIIVAYKNPGHNFATPYITSIYSGMMLDQYC